MLHLAQVRRMEAVSFRSFPSTSTYYDGTWAIRLTAGHAAKRLNSINPLDPSDFAHIDRRLELAERRFENFGRPLVFRQSPLAPVELEALLDRRGWERFEESIVMLADLYECDFSGFNGFEQEIETGQWVDSFLKLSKEAPETKPGLVEVIGSIEAHSGMFVRKDGLKQMAAVRCVQDNDLAGIFDLVTGEEFRGQGHARALVGGVLKWAKLAGARHAWLQVVADNEAAVSLYKSFGFKELYRYAYRKAASH